MKQANEFWWDSVTGPRKVVSEVISILSMNQMALLKVPSDLPWRHTMRGVMEAMFRERIESKDILIDTIDAEDEIETEEDPGYFLINKYSSDDETRIGYRESKRNSIQDYLKKNKILKNRVIWIKGLEGEEAKKWIRFCQKYNVESVVEGSFVLEIHGELPEFEGKNLKVVSYEENVSSYDVQLFNSVYLDEKEEYTNKWKHYISTVAACLCETDAEISKAFIDAGNFRTENPRILLERVANSSDYIQRGADGQTKHVLAICRAIDNETLNYKLWKAQMQILFPIIELERVQLIEKWEQNVKDALTENHVKQYDIQITNPYEAELGTLNYLLSHRATGTNSYMLYIPEQCYRDRIKFLHECRNLLAHVKCCSANQVAEIIG